jgi:ATP-binding cassette subfamily B protein
MAGQTGAAFRNRAAAARPTARAIGGLVVTRATVARAWREELVGPRWRIARLVPRAGAGLTTVLLLVNLVLGLLPVAFIVLTSVLVGQIPAAAGASGGQGPWRGLVVAFILAAVVFAAQQLLVPIHAALGELLARRVDGYVHDRLIAAAVAPTGVGPLERQEVLNELDAAIHELEHGFQSPGAACAGLLALVSRYTQLAGAVIVVAVVLSWNTGALLLAAIMVFRYGQRGGLRKYARVARAVTPMRRRVRYFRDLAMGADAAKEIRVFGLAGWLTDRYRAAWDGVLGPIWTERRRIYLWPYLAYTAFGLVAVAGVLLTLARSAGREMLTLTEVLLALLATVAAVRLGGFYPESDTQTQYGINAYEAVLRFERALPAAADPAESVEGSPPATPAQWSAPQRDIRFARVSFSYPGASQPVLVDLDLAIPAGRCTAVVGVNGAGKTTMVKLLARLYEPIQGAVLVDGVDLRARPVEAWRRQIAVIFQDFVRYELSAADNIGFGAVEVHSPVGIREAAEAAGILPALERLPRGLDSTLSRQYAGGAELSGGQWQRVALARVLFAVRHGASVLILDEPTAALDVRAEMEVFDRIMDLTRGTTTVLISHRFSTVRRADHIVVLDGGRVIEEGDHERLLAAGGRYAQMFRLQAERFTDAADTRKPDRPDPPGPGRADAREANR